MITCVRFVVTARRDAYIMQMMAVAFFRFFFFRCTAAGSLARRVRAVHDINNNYYHDARTIHVPKCDIIVIVLSKDKYDGAFGAFATTTNTPLFYEF